MLIKGLLFFVFSIVLINNAIAQTAITFVQPLGTIVQEWDPTLVNQYLEKWDSNIITGVTDSFDTHYKVSEVQPSRAMYFIRVFTGDNTNALGSYIVRASVIRNLTPQQIRNILALPTLPTKMAYVKVPANAQYGLWTGITEPINSPGYQWGQGGGEQTKIIGTETSQNPPADPSRFANYSRLPADSYMNVSLIGHNALSYFQSVSSGNASKVAAYLDNSLPQPYSDMEMVYTTLDYINEDGPVELAAALSQISPINFDTYSTVEFRNDMLFSNLLFKHQKTAPTAPSQTITTKRCFVSWANIAGEQGEQTQATDRVGFYYQTGVLAGGVDCQLSSKVKIGIAAGYLRNHLGWNVNTGNADIDNAKLGVYSHFTEDDYFVNWALTGGYDWSSAQRNINFYGLGEAVLSGQVVDALSVNRTASSNQTGENMGLYLNGGKIFKMNDWYLTPLGQVSYFYSRQDGFNESGADDLNLNVQSFTAKTLRTQLAILLGRLFNLKQGSIVKANVELGWAHNVPLDNRVITASLPSLGGQFSIKGCHTTANELLAGANVSTKVNKNIWIGGQYDADLSHGFNSQTVLLMLKYNFDA